MAPWQIAAVSALALLAAGGLLYWELVICEGAHLGARVVTLLYDWFAPRYDGVKGYDDADEAYYLATPLLDALALPAPFVLDVATGTARLPLALLREPAFNGRVIGVDLSRAMLAKAAAKLAPYGPRTALVWHAAVPLPFPAESFDAVTCLEALEFMPDVGAALGELARVLRPGGVLLVTRRKGRELVGLVQSAERFEELVRAAGLEHVERRVWQVDYEQVWARKPGAPARSGVRPLAEVLQCPACGRCDWVTAEREWRCAGCGRAVAVGADGIVEAA